MDGGRFEMRDIPGMVPDQAEIRQQAGRLAREMYPEKFGLEPKPQSEVTVRKGIVDDPLLRDEEFGERVASEIERGLRAEPGVQPKEWWPKHETEVATVQVAEPTGISPLSRLFAAVRGVLYERGSLDELKAAFEALKLDED